MRLDQKYFIPFMIAVAVIGITAIIFSAFNFNEERKIRFKENIAASDSLSLIKLPVVGATDSINIESHKGNPAIIVFWASWSDKSVEMLKEIQQYQNENTDLQVIAALVRDAEESLPNKQVFSTFTYVDGTRLYMGLKVPGYPSYILFDASGEVLHTQVGYHKGVVYDTLKNYLPVQ